MMYYYLLSEEDLCRMILSVMLRAVDVKRYLVRLRSCIIDVSYQ